MTKKQGVVLLSGGAVLLLVVLLMTLMTLWPATEAVDAQTAPDMPVSAATPTLSPSLSGGNDCYCARPQNAPAATGNPADATE